MANKYSILASVFIILATLLFISSQYYDSVNQEILTKQIIEFQLKDNYKSDAILNILNAEKEAILSTNEIVRYSYVCSFSSSILQVNTHKEDKDFYSGLCLNSGNYLNPDKMEESNIKFNDYMQKSINSLNKSLHSIAPFNIEEYDKNKETSNCLLILGIIFSVFAIIILFIEAEKSR